MTTKFGRVTITEGGERGPRGFPGLGVDDITFNEEEEEFVVTYTDESTTEIPFPESSLSNYVTNSNLSTTLGSYAPKNNPSLTGTATVDGAVLIKGSANSNKFRVQDVSNVDIFKINTSTKTTSIIGDKSTEKFMVKNSTDENVFVVDTNSNKVIIPKKLLLNGPDSTDKIIVYNGSDQAVFYLSSLYGFVYIGGPSYGKKFEVRDSAGNPVFFVNTSTLGVETQLIRPITTNTYDIGRSDRYFKNLYIKRIYLDSTYNVGFEAEPESTIVYLNGQQFAPKTTLGATLGSVSYYWFALYTKDVYATNNVEAKFVFATDEIYVNDIAVATVEDISDVRLKENINDIDIGLNFINELTPKKYNLIKDTTKKDRYGLIAQDVEQALNSFEIENSVIVKKNEKNDTYYLNYKELIPILIKSVQELSSKIEKLEQIISSNNIKWVE